MKLIKVILRPEKSFKVKDALHKLGYHGITTKGSLGYGESKTLIKEIYRGKVFEKRVETTKRIELEFVTSEYRLDKVIETILEIARTDKGGDGRIYVIPLENSIHIHTGDKHLGDSTETGFDGDK